MKDVESQAVVGIEKAQRTRFLSREAAVGDLRPEFGWAGAGGG